MFAGEFCVVSRGFSNLQSMHNEHPDFDPHLVDCLDDFINSQETKTKKMHILLVNLG